MRTAWILPGGSSFGAVQVGQLDALVRAGLAPDLLLGTSAGSLNATQMAVNPDGRGVEVLRDLWTGVRRREIFPFRPGTVIAGLAGRRDHTVSNAAFTRWIEAHVPVRRIEDARLPLTLTATDLTSGEPVFLTAGDTVSALLASTALPGVFPPVERDGRTLVDGGLVADAPVGQAVAQGAERVYILPAVGGGGPYRPAKALDVLLASTALVLGHATRTEVEAWAGECEVFVCPAPSVAGLSPFSFKAGPRLMAEARAATEAWLPSARPATPVHRPAGVRSAAG